MPQSTKDSAGGKSHPQKSTGASGGKTSDKTSRNPASPVGAQNKGEKKTTP